MCMRVHVRVGVSVCMFLRDKIFWMMDSLV